ncbi:hypothetical protein WJX73_003443 [Symbiochloris irregularis]|uniref:JmjC domain-containing protein n=1 Tax=Symbiochloris irregularis TaxID=706552 RepID=A0AAW1PRQ8_9CHLO
MLTTEGVLPTLITLSQELRDLDIGRSVPEVAAPLDPLQFLRTYVASNKPVLIQGSISHWPALRLWTNAYLIKALAEQKVTVASTPSGRADAICWQGGKPVFALPHEEQLPIATAFGTTAEAANIWIGSHRSMTSFHRDHYENIYAVVAGTKRFFLVPPCDRYRMRIMDVPVARYTPGPDGWELVLESPERKVPWCALDESLTDVTSHQSVDAAPLPEPLVVDVHAGEVLYLPSLWYHMVQQQDDDAGRVIAVNWWYDMQYDCKYAYAQLIDSLSRTCIGKSDAPVLDQQ